MNENELSSENEQYIDWAEIKRERERAERLRKAQEAKNLAAIRAKRKRQSGVQVIRVETATVSA